MSRLRWIARMREAARIARVLRDSADDISGWGRRLQSTVDTRGTLTLTTKECDAILDRGRPLFKIADRLAR